MGSRRFQAYGIAAALAFGAIWFLAQFVGPIPRGQDYLGDYYDAVNTHQKNVDAVIDSDSSSDNNHHDYDSTRINHSHSNHNRPGHHKDKGQDRVQESEVRPPEPPAPVPVPLARRNVTFASSFMYHGDVYMALAKSMADVMDAAGEEDGEINVFAQEWPYGFEEVVEDLRLWRHQGVRAHHDRFPEFLLSAGDGSGGGSVDLVVLGTCQYDLPFWFEVLKEAWNKRDADHKFTIACYVHNSKDMDWRRWIPYWSQRNAIRLVTLSDHVTDEFRKKLAEAADSRDVGLSTADFEHVAIDTHVPVLDVPDLPEKAPSSRLTRAVIQGKFEPDRRDYERIFQELIQSLSDDPAAWGYQPLNGRPSYEPTEESEVAPFELLLVGSQYLGIPQELENVVKIHRDLTYKEFYRLISQADVVLPAFADNSYYEIRASSTVALATELNVPMLVTRRTRRTYGFIDDERVVVTRPAAMSEVQALKALRTGDAASFLAKRGEVGGEEGLRMGEMPGVRAAVEGMMKEGWVKSSAGWREWKDSLWKRNREAAERILRDAR